MHRLNLTYNINYNIYFILYYCIEYLSFKVNLYYILKTVLTY